MFNWLHRLQQVNGTLQVDVWVAPGSTSVTRTPVFGTASASASLSPSTANLVLRSVIQALSLGVAESILRIDHWLRQRQRFAQTLHRKLGAAEHNARWQSEQSTLDIPTACFSLHACVVGNGLFAIVAPSSSSLRCSFVPAPRVGEGDRADAGGGCDVDHVAANVVWCSTTEVPSVTEPVVHYV